ncbi:MAG: hypothetical protein Q8P68_03460 [Candidatus Peregrinibacteria bacterium]|nr:hypothetical protein [Candidatus Peregrinibacteria bacterium]MDZ4245342.1 hypothetical protein [Candidatus Gracilibacteria bacterium]
MANTKDTVKNIKNSSAMSTQQHMEIAEIRDNTLVLKNGGIRTILKTSSINFNLKSEAEQNSIVYSYQGFLNSLEFPIQVLVRSKKLEIDEYIEKIRGLGEKQQNSLLKKQTYEYAEYIQKLVEYADIMEKEFYVIVPYDPSRAEKKGVLREFLSFMKTKDNVIEIKRRHSEFEQLKKGLSQRVNVVKTGLEQCGLKVDELTTHELIELFYKVYNPGISRQEKIDSLQDMNLGDDIS